MSLAQKQAAHRSNLTLDRLSTHRQAFQQHHAVHAVLQLLQVGWYAEHVTCRRRTFATKLNAQGVGMRTIQLLMGHQHIATTALYCDVTDEQLYRAANLA